MEGRTHYNHALALYDATEHRLLATLFGQDVAVATLSQRSLALWMLGYPTAALADAEQAISSAREIGQTATLMYALFWASDLHILRGNYATASALVDEPISVADEAGAVQWNANGMMTRGPPRVATPARVAAGYPPGAFLANQTASSSNSSLASFRSRVSNPSVNQP